MSLTIYAPQICRCDVDVKEDDDDDASDKELSGENNPDGDVTEVGENGDVDVKEDDDEDVSGEGRVPRSCLVGGNQTVIVCAPTICQNIKLQLFSSYNK